MEEIVQSVADFVKSKNINITFDTKLGEGSEFIITLPVRSVEIKDIIQSKEIVKPNYKENLEVEFSDIY